MIKLDDATIHRLVFGTFGLRRYTQDSPIQPDVWIRFLKLAADRNLKRRIPLLLTPKETPGKRDGRPAGGAGQLAEEIRRKILGTKRNQEPVRKPGETKIAPESALQGFKIAATARNVVIDANFSEVLRYLLPMTAWWVDNVDEKLRDPHTLRKELVKQSKRSTTIQKALIQLDDTEFFRFAALTAFVWMLGNAGDTDKENKALAAMIEALAPERRSDDFEDQANPHRAGHTVKDIAELWTHYVAVAQETFAIKKESETKAGDATNAASLDAELLIWSIQRNRPAQRDAAVSPKGKGSIPGSTAVARARLSRQTVKADAAGVLFAISTADLTWAVVDTGIDATHPAFNNPPSNEPFDRPCRVLATLDFTRLRDLLAEEFDVDEVLKTFAKGANVDPGAQAARKNQLLTTIDSIRRRNVNGRELDWSLLEPIIRRDPGDKDTPVPADPHGTHVAGILGGNLPNGLTDNKEPFLGVCPDIRFYDLRVFGEGRNGEPTGGDEFTILAALDYITWVNRDPERPAIHGVNLSLSLQHQVDAHACGRTPLCDACNRLVGNGTIVVAAAGNAGFDEKQDKATLGSGYRGTSITDPGNADLVITVGATHRNDPHVYGVSYFSSRGPTGDGRAKPDLVAPGEKIRSTVPGGKMLIKDGTSMAAPHVSGVCAMLMARHREFIGRPKRIKEILMATATDLGRERNFQGAGLVDALRAIQSI